jgi:hypothetical protein
MSELKGNRKDSAIISFGPPGPGKNFKRKSMGIAREVCSFRSNFGFPYNIGLSPPRYSPI